MNVVYGHNNMICNYVQKILRLIQFLLLSQSYEEVLILF